MKSIDDQILAEAYSNILESSKDNEGVMNERLKERIDKVFIMFPIFQKFSELDPMHLANKEPLLNHLKQTCLGLIERVEAVEQIHKLSRGFKSMTGELQRQRELE
jgi:hypothetical protein